MRCFVAIELPETLRAGLIDAITSVKETAPHWRDAKWVRPEQLHITLKFLGELEQASVDGLIRDLEVELSTLRPFALDLAAIRAVPGAHRARMLWASFDDPSALCTELAGVIDRVAIAYGVAPEERTFRPHATLCRARRPLAIPGAVLETAIDVVPAAALSMSVVHATVLSSRLTPHGPIYSELAHLRLGGA